jgi:flagellin
VIRDSDFASETSSLTRAQILVSSAQNTLALANAQPQSALQLLG